jgi:hypothetical protein
MRWFFAAALSCVLFAAVASSTFVPLYDSAGIDYLFALPGMWRLASAAMLAVALVTALFAGVLSLSRRASDGSIAAARDGRWLAPLVALALIILGILPAVPGIGEHASPFGYFFHDLRWWWLGVLGGWTLLNADTVLGSPIQRRIASIATWHQAARLLLMDGVVCIAVMAWAVASTPHLRFIGVLHGDEPKYIRYCEVWYQGGGLDISQKSLFADEPLDSSPHLLTTAARLPRAIIEETGDLFTDLRQFAAHPFTFRWNRAVGGNGFVRGTHGGIYEIYQPGVSAVLFPGYFIDRYLLGLNSGYQGEFPDELVMTSISMLLVFGFCGVALFRLLRNLLRSEGLAVFWAAIGVMALPTGAFAFQFYPELVALLILLILGNFLLTRPTTSATWQAIAAGAATGALGWLHPRFLLLSAAIALVAIVRMRAGARRAFIAAFATLLLSIMGYAYRVTGSWLPTALWDAVNSEGGTLNGFAVPMNLVGYMFHRTWGLLPQSLIFIAAIPGLVLLARRMPAVVAVAVLFGLCLGVPAAGHTLSAAAGTPGRLVLAVVPLFIWPVAVLIHRFWSSRLVRSAAMLLVMLSLDAATTYNWSHKKHLGPMHAGGTSGWKPNLMFPNASVNLSEWTVPSVITLAAFILVIAAVSIAAWRFDGTQRPKTSDPAAMPIWRPWLIVVGGAIACCVALTATMGSWYHTEYLMSGADAHRAAARALVSLDRCRVCFTSRLGSIDWTSLNPNRVDSMTVDLTPARRKVELRVKLVGGDSAARFGRVHVDFGDGNSTRWSGIVDEGRYEHEYQQPGTYSVVTWLQLRDGRTQRDRRTVSVGDTQSGG